MPRKGARVKRADGDAQDFLGMSPRAFLEINMPLLKRSLALRKAVLGTPAQALDPAPDIDPRD